MNPFQSPLAACLSILALVSPLAGLQAQTIAPAFAADYSFIDLGAATDVPAPYGGLTLLAGDLDTLLLGGGANGGAGAIYSIGVTRDIDGHITAFSGAASLFASAANIDGGLAYGPGGILFATTFSNNTLLQFKTGSTSPDKIIDLNVAGVVGSTGSVAFVPTGLPDAGAIRLLSYSGGGFYSGVLAPDGLGTFDLTDVLLETTTGFGPEGMVYVPTGSPVFTGDHALISEYGAGRVSAYELDVDGIPIPASREDFITDLGGAEGAFIDPVTGDFLFSTFGGSNRVIVVRGFAVPEPASASMLAAGALAILARRRRA